jgi:hypothetical protein
MMNLSYILSLATVWLACSLNNDVRELYDLDLPDSKVVKVSTTASGISTPMGVAVGHFQGKDGVFYSSYSQSDIWFITTNKQCELAGTCAKTRVAGTGFAGVDDGPVATSSFIDPSRIMYMDDLNILVVADRGSGTIRYVSFDDSTVGTMKTSSGTKLQLVGNQVSDNSPELDIKRSGNYFYACDTKYVYNITGDDQSLARSFNYGVIKKYTALASWQAANDYESVDKVFITSIAIDTVRNRLYVSYTFSRSAILVMPLELKSPSDIQVLSSDGVLYRVPLTYPRPVNGKLYSTVSSEMAVITFPCSMYYDENDDILYWTEVYPTSVSGSYAVGAVAVRRLKFSTGMIDYYAGDTGTFRATLGRPTGYVDGASDIAMFKYPVTIGFHSSMGTENTGPMMYIADYNNGAIRKVSTIVDTPSPTLSPTYSVRPTPAPSV